MMAMRARMVARPTFATARTARPVASIAGATARKVSVKATIITAEEDDCEKDEACDDPFAEMDCYLVNTSVNNKSDPDYTILNVSVQSYPALHQTIFWTLNGLGIRAQNAKLEMADDGYSENKFWLLDYNGKKLSDTKAENLQERIRDFVLNCQPHMMNEQEVWECGNMKVSNTFHPDYTELIIEGEPSKPGFLLEITSVLGSIGATVHEGIIQGDAVNDEVNVAPEGHDFRQKGRVFRFLITDGVNGGKLNAGRVNSVLYMMDLVAGKGYQPTRLKKIDHDVPVASLCQPSAYLTGDHRAPAYLA